MANQLVVIYWRDIPAQVNAQAGRRRHQQVLDRRFQLAIDRAAMVAGKKTAQEYIAEWRRESRPCGDDLEAEATGEATRLEAAYDRDRLNRLVDHGGIDPDRS
jgi:hypothetical protein